MFELVAIVLTLVGGICIGTRWGQNIPLINKLSK